MPISQAIKDAIASRLAAGVRSGHMLAAVAEISQEAVDSIAATDAALLNAVADIDWASETARGTAMAPLVLAALDTAGTARTVWLRAAVRSIAGAAVVGAVRDLADDLEPLSVSLAASLRAAATACETNRDAASLRATLAECGALLAPLNSAVSRSERLRRVSHSLVSAMDSLAGAVGATATPATVAKVVNGAQGLAPEESRQASLTRLVAAIGAAYGGG